MHFRRAIQISIFFFLIFISANCFCIGETLHYSKIKQEIEIVNDKIGYKRKVSYEGRFLNKTNRTISINCGELERIEVLTRFDMQSGKSIKEDVKANTHPFLTTSFYDNRTETSIKFRDTSSAFKYQYESTCRYLINLSTLPLVNYPNADTLVYKIISPLNIFVRFESDSSFRFIHIDSIIDSRRKTYRVISIPEYKLTIKRGIVSRYEINRFVPPQLRIMIIPAGSENEWNYFNRWFTDLIKDNITLNKKSIGLFDAFITDKETEEERVRKIFDYVKSNITYVSIENGLEAFRPRDVNVILENKYGDCKDMANVLCQVLKHYKLISYIALTSALGYPFDMSFPCLASANHAICILKTPASIYYLDATDKNGVYYLPSPFIQGQKYFINNENQGELGKVPIVSPLRNLNDNYFDYSLDKQSLMGTYKGLFRNYSGFEFRYFAGELPEKEASIKIKKALSQAAVSISYSNPVTVIKDSTIQINAEVNCINAFTHPDNKNFLFFKFLIFPHGFPTTIRKGFRFVTFQTLDRQYTYRISFGKKIKIISALPDFIKNSDVFSFAFNVKMDGDQALLIECRYKMDKIELNPDEIKEYETLNKDILKIVNSSIEYEIEN